ncbi:hypothetical protein CEK62_13865 [Alcanivorax sp. N3-2A]|nr:hypothetical protein CEK62_13865 [Alcanivorax sp. N3-2A]
MSGPEGFVESIYKDFKDQLTLGARREAGDGGDLKVEEGTKIKQKAGAKKKARKAPKKQSATGVGSIIKDLDLSGAGKNPSLRDFYSKYSPSNNQEKILIFAYYLKLKIELEGVSVNHFFTCYRSIPGEKVPGNLRQILVNTSNRKGWIDTSDMDDISVPIAGINYIEHDMEKVDSEE